MRKTVFPLLLLLFFLPLICRASLGNQNISTTYRELEFGLSAESRVSSGENSPFWFTSGRQGVSTVSEYGSHLRLSALGGVTIERVYSVNYGIDMVVTDNYQSDIFLQQIYFDFGYKNFFLSLGSKERWGELKNTRLSSGGLTWSGNSRPIPQIRLDIPDYLRIKSLGDWFSLKGHIAYGSFTDSRWRGDIASRLPGSGYADGTLFHSKAGFLKFGDVSRFPLEVTLGLEMYAQFGGIKHNMIYKGVYYDEYLLPDNLAAYLEVLMPFNPIGNQGDENGNNLGSWHLVFDATFDRWKFRYYYEHFYEDHSSMLGIEYKNNAAGEKEFVFYGVRHNWFDGLFGLEINAPDGLIFDNIVFEFLNTKGLCGSICNLQHSIITEGVDGRDGMYNHSIYQSYQHWGYAIGNPVLLSPVYNDDGSLSFLSNRVNMYHLGIDGKVTPSIDYRLLITHVRHWGTYEKPFRSIEKITSLFLECSYRFGESCNWKIGASGAIDFDSGTRLGNNKGIMFSISRIWDIL